MRAAFYIAQRGKLFDRLISGFDGGRYSHVELLFSDGTCFSSSSRDGGVRFKFIEFDAGKWDFVDLDVPDFMEPWLRDWCADRVGARYDYLGVLHFPLLWIRQDRRRWFCSEICVAALQSIGRCLWADPCERTGPVAPSKTTPNRLYELLTKPAVAKGGRCRVG